MRHVWVRALAIVVLMFAVALLLFIIATAGANASTYPPPTVPTTYGYPSARQ